MTTAAKNGSATKQARELSDAFLSAKHRAERIKEKIDALIAPLKTQLGKAETELAELKDRLTEAAVNSGRKRIDCKQCLIEVMPGRSAVKVTSIDKLPEEFVTRTAKKAELLKALKALAKSESIPGAKMITGDPFITVKEFDV